MRLPPLLACAALAGLSVAVAACTGDIGGVAGPAVEPCLEEGAAEYCYPGPPTQQSVGICTSGTRTCIGGAWSECSGHVLADSQETCGDGLDNDCNGLVDEHCPCAGEGQPCYTGPAVSEGVGACTNGLQKCVDGALTAECAGEVTPREEQCEGVDDDCDGLIDEGCACLDGDTQPCYSGPSGTKGVGVCHGGQQLCAGGQWSDACEGQKTPGAESCNGKDDDCDGEVDEGGPGSGGSCSSGKPGVCSAGTLKCTGGELQCKSNTGASSEKCNGLDDDCDGKVDNGNPGGGGSCGTGKLGVCGAGTLTCSGGKLVCQANTGPTSEKCNGLDDDCDGSVDEGNPESYDICDSGKPGICKEGLTWCSFGKLSCTSLESPSGEKCDGYDNDCDGKVDDGNPGGGSCSTGKLGVCGPGTKTCTNGKVGPCVSNVGASSEKCNGLDDDCDGSVDEGNPESYQSCNAGYGICKEGLTWCQNGKLSCTSIETPYPEKCDGADNDCDGKVDDGNPGGGSCSTGKLGVCGPGTKKCTNGKLGSCVSNVGPSSEKCNGLDDDCDGSVDEGNPGSYQSCDTGKTGICKEGLTWCSFGKLKCTPIENGC